MFDGDEVRGGVYVQVAPGFYTVQVALRCLIGLALLGWIRAVTRVRVAWTSCMLTVMGSYVSTYGHTVPVLNFLAWRCGDPELNGQALPFPTSSDLQWRLTLVEECGCTSKLRVTTP